MRRDNSKKMERIDFSILILLFASIFIFSYNLFFDKPDVNIENKVKEMGKSYYELGIDVGRDATIIYFKEKYEYKDSTYNKDKIKYLADSLLEVKAKRAKIDLKELGL